MQFSRVASLALFFLTFGLLVIGSPVVDKRADNADILAVVNTLKGSTDSILPQITALTTSGNVSEAAAAPLVSALTDAFTTAGLSLTALDVVPLGALAKRQSDDQIANLIAEILTDVANVLDTLLNSLGSTTILGGLLAGLDTSINQVLKGLETLLAGVLTLVANLLVGVAGLLRALAFGLTLASLGL